MKESFDINKLDIYKENNRLEVKKAKGGLPISLWESYSAFANTEGGVIVLGVAENNDKSWRASGLSATDTDKLLKSFWDTVNDSSKVSINLLTDASIETYEIGEHLIIVIHVPKANRDQKPVYINDNMFSGTYKRDWEGDYHCTKEAVRAMLRDAVEDTPDMKLLEDNDISVIDIESLHAYRNCHKSWKPNHVFEIYTDEEYMSAIGAAAVSKIDGKLHPTAAGLLMFGLEYNIVREFPEYFLDYRETLDPSTRWTDRLQSSSGDWTGNVMDFFFRVSRKITKDLKVPFKLDGIVRVDDTPVHKAMREALINCLLNTDYFVPRGVVIKKEENAIIMENPGSIRTGKSQMLRGGISDPRNKALMKMFNLIGFGERAGSGVPDIFAVWDSQGWNAPEIEELHTPDRTIVTLPLVKKSADKKPPVKTASKKPPVKTASKTNAGTNSHISAKEREKIQRVLSGMKDGEWYKTSEIMDILGLKGSRTREVLREMASEGLIEDNGTYRNRMYRKTNKLESYT